MARVAAEKYNRVARELEELKSSGASNMAIDLLFEMLIKKLEVMVRSQNACRELVHALTNCEQAEHWLFAYFDRIETETNWTAEEVAANASAAGKPPIVVVGDIRTKERS